MRLPGFLRAPRRPPLWALGAGAALGAGVALGQAPFGLWWLALLALWPLFPLAQRFSPGWIGFAAGFGYAALAMFWIVEPFFVEPEIYGWMAPFALIFMSAGMGVFWALGLGLGARLGATPPQRAAGMAAGLLLSDALRSYVFTGFPWVLFGHIWIGTPVAQAAAFVGPLGLSAITLALAVAPWLIAAPKRRWIGEALAALVLAALWQGGEMRLAAPEAPRVPALNLRLVQPDAEQALKWLPDYRLPFFYRHLDLTAQAPAEGKPRPDLIVWPETAVPFLLDDPGDGLRMIADAAGGVPVALGVQRSEGMRYYNSLALIGPGGTTEALYDKIHLVPFGEYIPWGDVMAHLGIAAFAAQEGNGYSAGRGPRLFDLGKLGLAEPLICYEAVFPQDIRDVPRRPSFLLQVTNDAWFGEVSGPWQHLAQARLRAIEFGLPLARAANTGVSAMIDAKGRVLEELGMGVQGVIDAPLPPALPVTLYARIGDMPLIGFVLALALAIFLRARRYRVDPTLTRV